MYISLDELGARCTTIHSNVDGHPIRIFHSPLNSQKCTVLLVLPFGVPFHMAYLFFLTLSARYNVVTWEARKIIDDPHALHTSRTADDTVEITPRMHVADMMTVLARLRIERANVVGYCSGAGIALLAAQLYPNAVAQLVLVSGEYVLPPNRCARTRFQEEVASVLPFAARSRANASLISLRLTQGRLPVADPVANAAVLPFAHGEFLYRFGINYLSYQEIDFTQVATDVAHSTLVIVGERDEHVTVESSTLIHRQLRNARLHTEPLADHYDVCRAASPIGGAVLAFLKLGSGV